jgi:ubiquinone/menaquinone biosynthesis C-methylase UbiE
MSNLIHDSARLMDRGDGWQHAEAGVIICNLIHKSQTAPLLRHLYGNAILCRHHCDADNSGREMGSTDIQDNQDYGPSRASRASASPELFDDQAAGFERRAGLPVEVCLEIASRVLEMAEVGPRDLVVEIGAGTGQIGQWLGAAARYAGLDLSAGMLQAFAAHLAGNPGHRALIRADANIGWPIVERTARVIFGSRALHLLNHMHVAAEALRIASREGATLIVGRIARRPDSVRARMAREMNERLRHRGLEGRRGEQRDRRLIEACCRQGGQALPPVVVAAWQVASSPRQSLNLWRSIKGLAGLQVAEEVRDEVLTELEAWARDAFGGLDEVVSSEETYVLKGVRLPPSP